MLKEEENKELIRNLFDAVNRARWHLSHDLPLPEYQTTLDATMHILDDAAEKGDAAIRKRGGKKGR